MSFDPFHEQQPQRDPVPRPPLEPAAPNGPAPDMRADPRAARERVLFPAILLIIVGVVNLLFMGFCAFSTLVSRMQPIETQRANLNQNPQLKQMYDDLEAQFKQEADAIDAAGDPMTDDLQKTTLKPKKSNINVRALVLAWAPFAVDGNGAVEAW